MSICKGCQEKSKEDFKTFLMLLRKQSNLLEINYLSHVSVGNELHIEMLTENCLLQSKTTEPVNNIKDWKGPSNSLQYQVTLRLGTLTFCKRLYSFQWGGVGMGDFIVTYSNFWCILYAYQQLLLCSHRTHLTGAMWRLC